jgi:hypothetical protein
MWKSPILSFDLWKTFKILWKRCGENVEKNRICCGKGVDFLGKSKLVVKVCKSLGFRKNYGKPSKIDDFSMTNQPSLLAKQTIYHKAGKSIR